MQPWGLGIPPTLAASFAGPLGKSWYSSLIATPEALPTERADARRLAVAQVRLAHEPHDLPMLVGQLGNAVLARDRRSDLLVPLVRVGEETLAVDVDRRAGDGGGGHACSF
jgi:hypothetical protein